MRSKLLRALRHLKAASLHLQEAAYLIRLSYVGSLERLAVDPMMESVTAGTKLVQAQYAEDVFTNLDPAELP